MKCGPKPQPLSVRFIRHLKKGEVSDCWPCQCGITDDGYSQIKDENRVAVMAHRYALWFFKYQELMTWEEFKINRYKVCHTCDNPPCCNPDHLFLGTSKDNTQDMIKKGRRFKNRGVNHPMSKINEKEALEIYHMKGTLKEIASKYNISFQMVERIKKHKAWTHITKIEQV